MVFSLYHFSIIQKVCLCPEEIDQEKLKEITDEINQKVKEETFFDWINSKTPEQQSAIKRWITMQEQARDKQQL